MNRQNEIRADYDARTIVVYQAYPKAIALPALRARRFVAPFSFNRMTWIKPSLLWLMERSNWGQKSGQEYILAVRMTRRGWEEALSLGVLTHYEPKIYVSQCDWQTRFEQATVHIQWDPERSLRGADLGYNSIQVGLSRHLIQRYVDEWIVDIQDLTPTIRKLHRLMQSGAVDKAKRLLPGEKLYPISAAIADHLLMST